MTIAQLTGSSLSRSLQRARSHLFDYLSESVKRLGVAIQGITFSGQMSEFMHSYDARGERTLAVAQSLIAFFVLALHCGAAIGNNFSTLNVFVVSALMALIISSSIRVRLSKKDQLPELQLNTLNVIDVSVFLLLIWTYQFAYDHPATGVLKAPSVSLLFVLVSLRALRFHPVPLIVTGAAAVMGWLVLVLVALSANSAQGVTHDYVAYLTTYQVLVGAEVEKLFALTALTIFLAFATYRARLCLMELDNTLEHMPHGVAMFDRNNRLVTCNALYGELYGMTRNQVKPGMTARELVSLRQKQGIYCPDGSTRKFADAWIIDFENASNRIQELTDGRTLSVSRKRKPGGGIITTTVDITDLKRLEARLEHLAYHDALTGLLNRAGFNRQLRALLDRSDKVHFVLIIADLNKFKPLNDQHGHVVGDQALEAAARLFEDVAGLEADVCRIGGDEFAILATEEEADGHNRQKLIERLNKCDLRIEAGGEEIEVRFSLGAAFYPEHASHEGELLKHADLAMYNAKRAQRRTVQTFSPRMADEFDRLTLQRRDFQRATDSDEIIPYYHPLINLQTGRVEGLESLARWNHKQRGVLSPGDFSFIFSDSELKVQLAKRMVDCIVEDMSRWRSLGVAYESVGLNLEVTDLKDASLVPYLSARLNEWNIAPKDLAIEITENSELDMSDATLQQQLQKIRAAGMYIALDDFGTGYSSLSHMKKLPLTALKLDKTFVENICGSSSDYDIARCLLDMAKSIGVKSIAEGIECSEQLAVLKELGCDMGQGFLFSQPVPGSEVPKLVSSLNAAASEAKPHRLIE